MMSNRAHTVRCKRHNSYGGEQCHGRTVHDVSLESINYKLNLVYLKQEVSLILGHGVYFKVTNMFCAAYFDGV